MLRLILQQIRDVIPIRDAHGIWREDGDGDARRIVLRCRLEFSPIRVFPFSIPTTTPSTLHRAGADRSPAVTFIRLSD
jgi:hypothetical protein